MKSKKVRLNFLPNRLITSHNLNIKEQFLTGFLESGTIDLLNRRKTGHIWQFDLNIDSSKFREKMEELLFDKMSKGQKIREVYGELSPFKSLLEKEFFIEIVFLDENDEIIQLKGGEMPGLHFGESLLFQDFTYLLMFFDIKFHETYNDLALVIGNRQVYTELMDS